MRRYASHVPLCTSAVLQIHFEICTIIFGNLFKYIFQADTVLQSVCHHHRRHDFIFDETLQLSWSFVRRPFAAHCGFLAFFPLIFLSFLSPSAPLLSPFTSCKLSPSFKQTTNLKSERKFERNQRLAVQPIKGQKSSCEVFFHS